MDGYKHLVSFKKVVGQVLFSINSAAFVKTIVRGSHNIEKTHPKKEENILAVLLLSGWSFGDAFPCH